MPLNPIPPTDSSSPAKRPKLAHIVDTMADITPSKPPNAPKIPFAPLATPTPSKPTGTPSKDKGKEPAAPIPRSTFSTHNSANSNPRAWQPRCNHITMTRIYHTDFRCQHCHRHGSFGWLYRCTQDRDLLIQDVYGRGGICWWDDLGAMFAPHMSLGKWGADKRSADPLAVLKEMAPAELQEYTPVQVARLVEQRMEVQKAIQAHSTRRISDLEDSNRSWVPCFSEECQYKICHSCYRGGQDKATLSLNGILNAHIPPTAAVGLTYSYIGMRPTLDADIVANLGYRAVPLPRRFPISPTPSTSSSDWSAMDLIDHHLASDNNHPVSSASAPSNRNSQQRNPSGPVWWAAAAPAAATPTPLCSPPVSHQRRAQPSISMDSPPGFAPVPNPQLLGMDLTTKHAIPYDLETRFGSLQKDATTDSDSSDEDETLPPLPRTEVQEWSGSFLDVVMDPRMEEEKMELSEADEDEEGDFVQSDSVVVDDGAAITEDNVRGGPLQG